MVDICSCPNASYSTCVDLLRSNTQPRRGGAVDHDIRLQTADLLIAVDVLELRNGTQLLASSLGAHS